MVDAASILGPCEAPDVLLRWEIVTSGGEVASYLTGPRRIDDDDPRLSVRETLQEAVGRVPSATVYGARTPWGVEYPYRDRVSSAARMRARVREALEDLGALVRDASAGLRGDVAHAVRGGPNDYLAPVQSQVVLAGAVVHAMFEFELAKGVTLSVVVTAGESEDSLGVSGVVLRWIRCGEGGDDAVLAERVTNVEGVIQGVALMLDEDCSYVAHVEYCGATWRICW